VPGELSPRLAEGAARLGAQVPFERAAALLGFFWGVEVSADTVRRQTEAAGAALVAAERREVERLERDFPPPPAGPAVAQWSMDGAFVPLARGEWAEVKTAAFGVVQQVAGPAGEPAAQTTDLSYFSRLGEVGPFSRDLRAELHRRGIQAARTVVAVNDGAEWIQGVLDTYRRDAVRILDFPHAVGYLARAAQTTFGADSLAAARWLAEHTRALKHAAPEGVLAALRALPAEQATEAAGALEARATALGYLVARRDQLRYADFRAEGYPIGSGAMESACKLVVEARMKGAGMHWGPANVSPMVALRAALCSGRWEAVWPAIQQERRRQARDQRLVRARQRRPPEPAPPPPPAKPKAHLSSAHRRLHAGAPPKIVDGRPTADHPLRRPFKQAG
jgi:hypothetical protein